MAVENQGNPVDRTSQITHSSQVQAKQESTEPVAPRLFDSPSWQQNTRSLKFRPPSYLELFETKKANADTNLVTGLGTVYEFENDGSHYQFLEKNGKPVAFVEFEPLEDGKTLEIFFRVNLSDDPADKGASQQLKDHLLQQYKAAGYEDLEAVSSWGTMQLSEKHGFRASESSNPTEAEAVELNLLIDQINNTDDEQVKKQLHEKLHAYGCGPAGVRIDKYNQGGLSQKADDLLVKQFDHLNYDPATQELNGTVVVRNTRIDIKTETVGPDGVKTYKLTGAGAKDLGHLSVKFIDMKTDGSMSDYTGYYPPGSPVARAFHGYFKPSQDTKLPFLELENHLQRDETLEPALKDIAYALMLKIGKEHGGFAMEWDYTWEEGPAEKQLIGPEFKAIGVGNTRELETVSAELAKMAHSGISTNAVATSFNIKAKL